MKKEELDIMTLLRMIDAVETEQWDGTKEQAVRWADKFTDEYGMKAFVIRCGKKYEWVTKWWFKTRKYEGKIYYETKVEDDG